MRYLPQTSPPTVWCTNLRRCPELTATAELRTKHTPAIVRHHAASRSLDSLAAQLHTLFRISVRTIVTVPCRVPKCSASPCETCILTAYTIARACRQQARRVCSLAALRGPIGVLEDAWPLAVLSSPKRSAHPGARFSRLASLYRTFLVKPCYIGIAICSHHPPDRGARPPR